MNEKNLNEVEQHKSTIPPPARPPAKKPAAVPPKGRPNSSSKELDSSTDEDDNSKLITNSENSGTFSYNYTPLPPYRQGYKEKNKDLAIKLAKQKEEMEKEKETKSKNRKTSKKEEDASEATTENEESHSERKRKRKKVRKVRVRVPKSEGDVNKDKKSTKKVSEASEVTDETEEELTASKAEERKENTKEIENSSNEKGKHESESSDTEGVSNVDKSNSEKEEDSEKSETSKKEKTHSAKVSPVRPKMRRSNKNSNTDKRFSAFISTKYKEESSIKNDAKRRTNSTIKKSQSTPGKKIVLSTEQEEIDEKMEEEDALIEVKYQFNSNPKKNIKALCDFFGKEQTPENIAELMHTTSGLLGNVIGDYLSRKENEEILDAYFMQIDLKTDFINAMRLSLSGPLYLPGEAQQIDRVVQTFANCYIKQNPNSFSIPENAYILSFALIMLNSDLHNPNVQQRMTVQQFLRNTKGSLSSGDLSDDELINMYNQLKETPFKFSATSNEFMAMSAPKLKGFLQMKMKKNFAKLTKHYFVLVNSCMYYFKDDSQSSKDQPQGMVQLTEVDVQAETKGDKTKIILKSSTDKQIQIVTFEKGIPNVIPNIKVIEFEAPDDESTQKWLQRIKKSIIISNFNDPAADGADFNDTDNVSDAEK